MSNEDFKRNYSKLLKLAGDKIPVVARQTAIQLQSSMVEKSPVDTGRFRGNWNCGIGAVDVGTTDSVDPSGGVVMGRTVTALNKWKLGDTIFLTNSLPYARPLEYGHSKQAPQGMVRLTIVEYGAALERAVRGVR